MDTHATPTPRRHLVSRLKWPALILVSCCLLVFAIYYLVNSSRVAAARRNLRSPEVAVRVAAVKELGALGQAANSAIPDLLERLRNDESYEVQNAVVEVLWKIGPDTSAGFIWLHARLDDPDASVRTHAVFILGCDRPSWLLDYVKLRQPWVKAAVSALAVAARDQDRTVRWMAITGIMRHAGPYASEAVPVLIEAVGSTDFGVRHNAIIALGRIGPPAKPAVRALAAAVRKPFPQVEKQEDYYLVGRAHLDRLVAAIALGNIGEAAVPELVSLLKDRNEGIRDAAIMAYPRAGVAAAPALLELLRDPDALVRQSAVRALSSYRGERVVTALVLALKDEDASVRKSAASSLFSSGADSEVAVPALIPMLKDADEDIVWTIIFSFGEMGSKAKPAIPALLEIARDETRKEQLRTTAATAALKIAPETESALPAQFAEQAKQQRKDDEEFRTKVMTSNIEQDINPMYR